MNPKNSMLSPVEQVQAIVKKGLSSKGRKNRHLYRQIRQALKLAHMRGYHQAREFFDFFNHSQAEEKTAKRLVKKLLSYISLTEFLQLTVRSTAI